MSKYNSAWMLIVLLVCCESILADEQNYLQAALPNGTVRWQLHIETEPVRLQLISQADTPLLEYDLQECAATKPMQRELILVPAANGPLVLVDCRGRIHQTLSLYSTGQAEPIAQYSATAPINYRVEPGAISIEALEAAIRWPAGESSPVSPLQHMWVRSDTALRFGPNIDSPLLALLNNPVQLLAAPAATLPDGWLLVKSDAGLLGYVREESLVREGQAEIAGLDWYFSEEPALVEFLAQALAMDISALAQVRAPAAGAWIASVNLDGDGPAELLAIPNHSCSNVACELLVLRNGSAGYQLLGQIQTFGQPRLSGKWRSGWRSLVRYELGEGPTCCAPRIALEFAPDNQGNWRDHGPAIHSFGHEWKMP
ncbi:hypothetical protein PSEUDO9AZ_40194 [Pseudomonas sp. 9AZ]|uniref:hypothetical protein n=1 Tax=Pseudomonas sp. 9AZ TaxID=2653168 RepID=UPI0012F39F91|nr:hypothetical protein [Pseudomonas sp. 9AZ]VXD00239.1 hypothetical protein PSEUDO9AZ_40194 [Pseudomonas sp. 9AZ]